MFLGAEGWECFLAVLWRLKNVSRLSPFHYYTILVQPVLIAPHSQGTAACHHHSYLPEGPPGTTPFRGVSKAQRSQAVFPAQGLVTVDQAPNPRYQTLERMPAEGERFCFSFPYCQGKVNRSVSMCQLHVLFTAKGLEQSPTWYSGSTFTSVRLSIMWGGPPLTGEAGSLMASEHVAVFLVSFHFIRNLMKANFDPLYCRRCFLFFALLLKFSKNLK